MDFTVTSSSSTGICVEGQRAGSGMRPGCCSITVLIASIFLQCAVSDKAVFTTNTGWRPINPPYNGHTSWSLSSASTSVSSSEDPSDSEILNAVIQSMQSYYARQATKNRSRFAGNLTRLRLGRHRRDEEVACYEDLGCFRDEGPFDYLDMLPLPPERIQTRFLLQTRQSIAARAPPVVLHYANITSMYTGVFNRSNPTKIMIHGFGSSCEKIWANEMQMALLTAYDVNVICVDWAAGAALPNYVQAAANARLVGKQVARLVRGLNALRGTKNTGFHLIGFSLGAHVAGFAGEELGNISRITGLDPAAPLFENYSPKARLDPTDANFVDVIHSNGESLLYGGLGAFDTMGHVDFYPNGGKVQAGCSNIFVGAISDLISFQPKLENGRSLCNHRRATKFFTDSMLTSCLFPAFACDDFEKFIQGKCFECGPSNRNCAQMGYHADKFSSRGKFYLLTRETEPFCANQFKVVVESSMGLTSTHGSLELTLTDSNHMNETFQLSSDSEELVPGQPLSRVIVVDPSLANLVSVQIKYTPYKGWITNGLQQWAVDRLTLVDSFQQKRGLRLAEGRPTTMYLRNEDCMDFGGSNQAKLTTNVKSTADYPLHRPQVNKTVLPISMINSISDTLHGDDYFLMPLASDKADKKAIYNGHVNKSEGLTKAALVTLIDTKHGISRADNINPGQKKLNEMYFKFALPNSSSSSSSLVRKGVQTVAFRQKFVDQGPNTLMKKHNTDHQQQQPQHGHHYGKIQSMHLMSGAAGMMRMHSPYSNRIGRKLAMRRDDDDGRGHMQVFVPGGDRVDGLRYIQVYPPFASRISLSSSRMLQGPPPPPHQRAIKMLSASATAASGRVASHVYLYNVSPERLVPSKINNPLPPPSPR